MPFLPACLRRTALVLAALLVPVVVLPALVGLVICPGPDGPTTSWDPTSDCPRQGLMTLPAEPLWAADEAPAASTCIALPRVYVMVTAEASLAPPTLPSFLIDRAGEVRSYGSGMATRDMIEPVMAGLVAEERE